MEDLQKELEIIVGKISVEQQSLFALKSIANFLQYYDKIIKYKSEVEPLLIEYFRIMKHENYFINKDISTELAGKYISNIGRFYSVELGFKTRTTLSYALIWGIFADLLLLLSGFLSKIYYIPIITFCLLTSWWYKKEFYEKRIWYLV